MRLSAISVVVLCLISSSLQAADVWPALPAANGAVQIPAQEWPLKPGPRQVTVTVHYPSGKLANVTEKTGLMLSLHNWGGTGCGGAASPQQLADHFNVVCLCIDYLQSGDRENHTEAYDCGYLQSLDALRGLAWLEKSLVDQKLAFAKGRVYATGGSGGGNVTLMANKLAPRTFACSIDMCGMARLTDDMAFNLPGGTGLNARWSKDPASPNYLSPDHQQIRFVGEPTHLEVMKKLGNSSRVIVVHGAEDDVCPTADAREMVANMEAAKLTVEPWFVTSADLDGKIFSSTGHALGNRTLIVFKVADQYVLPDSPKATVRTGPSDFERREEIVYPTANGKFVISYAEWYPVGRFEKK